MFSVYSESPLPACDGKGFRGMAFDGHRYYLPIRCRCAVAVFDCALAPVEEIATHRAYTAICYDPGRECFWALSPQHRTLVFKLDCCLREIDSLEPRVSGRSPQPLTGLAHCRAHGGLLLSGADRLLEVDPDSGETRQLFRAQRADLIPAVACLPPYIFFSVLRGTEAYFVLASRDGKVLAEKKAPEASTAVAMLPGPRTGDLLLLTTRHGRYPYLLHARLEEEIAGPCSPALCCDCEEEGTCGEACPPAGAESVALVEASLARILNAEGEKLQAAIERSAPVCELLAVNESVQRTLGAVTRLEVLLASRSEALQRPDKCPPQEPRSRENNREESREER